MLVLSRHLNEAILIGKDIRIVITEIRGDKVRLGIECPREISVDREEIRDLKDAKRRRFDGSRD